MKLIEIEQWADERNLNTLTPDRNGFNAFITEELGEYISGVRINSIHEQIDACCDIIVFSVGDMFKRNMDVEDLLGSGDIINWHVLKANFSDSDYVEDIVFSQFKFLEANGCKDEEESMVELTTRSISHIISLGYDPDLCMEQTMKEINSRVGAYSEETKKWQKDKSSEAQSNWYTADFTNCKLIK